MMAGSIRDFVVYNELEFACRVCGYIHFENMWRPFYKQDFEKFQVRCLNNGCRTYLIVVKIGNYMFVTEKKIETLINKKQKTQAFMKRIDVQKHLKRYEGVEINDKLLLIEALRGMIEEDRKQTIEDMKVKLAQLENGEIPPPPAANPGRPKRSRKKKDEQAEEEISDEL